MHTFVVDNAEYKAVACTEMTHAVSLLLFTILWWT